MDKSIIEDIRKVYHLQSLSEKDIDSNPIKQFETWWQQVIESKIDEPNAMALSTSGKAGKPSSRIVLLKGIQENGFIFYTNYLSHKGKEIESNPFVSLLFFWKELERQVRIEGTIEKLSGKKSDEYFSKRPVESRIGAWSSPQSNVIDSRNVLEEKFSFYKTKFQSQEIPRPENWGGYIVHPELIEFWQGRPGRLHDRLQYTITNKNVWKVERLAP